MNYIGILEGVEKVITGMLFWLIFIPKTLFKIIVDPGWVSGYVSAQLEKGSNKFDDYISPVILFILSSVILFLFFDYLAYSVLGENINNAAFSFGYDASQDVGKNLSTHKGLITGIAFLSIPLFFSLVIGLVGKQPLTRSNIYRLFCIQCYYLTPFSIAYFTLLIGSRLDPEDAFLTNFIIGILGVLTWFILSQVSFIKKELNLNIWKAIALFVLLFVFVSGGIIVLAIFIQQGLGGVLDNLIRIIGTILLVILIYALLRGIWSIVKRQKSKIDLPE